MNLFFVVLVFLSCEMADSSQSSNPGPVKSVWGVPLQTHFTSPSLSEVMSEQLANDLTEKEEKSELKKLVDQMRMVEDRAEVDGACASDTLEVGNFVLEESDDCTDDLLIAQMLQLQFDQVGALAMRRCLYLLLRHLT